MPSKSSSSSSPSSECVTVSLNSVWFGGAATFSGEETALALPKGLPEPPPPPIFPPPSPFAGLSWNLSYSPNPSAPLLTDGRTDMSEIFITHYGPHPSRESPPTASPVQFSHQHNDEPFRIMRCAAEVEEGGGWGSKW